MGKLPAILIMAFILLALATEGCFGPPQTIVVTVGPTTAPGTVTPTPAPTVATPTVTTADGQTIVRGSKDQLVRGVRLGDGVFIVSWSSSGSSVSLSLTDIDGKGASDLSNGQPAGRRLFVVDEGAVRSGEFTLMVRADSAWSITIARPDISSASRLPLAASCSEQDGAIVGPFRTQGGVVKVSYALSHVTQGNGYVNIYDASSGRFFRMRPITGDSQLGQSMSLEELPSEGVYIAQVNIPVGASHADITISQ
jgi:hypothetical protein